MKLLTSRYFIRLITILCTITVLISSLPLSIFSLTASADTSVAYKITFEEESVPYYYPGKDNSISHNTEFVLENEVLADNSNNRFMRYTNNTYSEKMFALYDAAKINATPLTSNLTAGTRNYSILAKNANTGNKMLYRISFKYRINSIAGGNVKFSLVTFNAANVWGVSTTTSLHTDAVKTESGWQEYSKEMIIDASVCAWNTNCLGLKVYGNAQVDIDDIKIEDYTPVNSCALVSFDTKGGNTLLSQIMDLSTQTLPTPTYEDKYFSGWTTDANGNNLFKPDEFDHTTDGLSLTLYAKWSDGDEINIDKYIVGFEEESVPYYYPGTDNSISHNTEFVLENEVLADNSNNRFMRYANNAYSEKMFALYDAAKINATPLTSNLTAGTRNYSILAKNANTGNKMLYRISFKYRINSIAGGDVKFSLVTFNAANVWGVSTTTLLHTDAVKTESGWQEYSKEMIIDASVCAWNTNCLGLKVYGNAQVDIDDIIIEDYTPAETCALVSFDTKGGDALSPQIINLSAQILPTPTYAGKNFLGWTTDANGENPFKSDEYDRTTNGLSFTLYAKWSDSAEINIDKYTVGFEEESIPYYYPGTDNSISHNTEFVLENEVLADNSNNRFMRYANNDYSEKMFALYDVAKINSTPLTSNLTAGTRNYSILANNANTGNKMLYRISFKYRINSIAGGDVKFSLVTFNAANVWGVSTTTLLHTDAVKTESGWQEYSNGIVIDASVCAWNTNCLGLKVYGNAQVDIDDIIIEDYTPVESCALVNFETNGGETLLPRIMDLATQTLPTPIYAGKNFLGWTTDINGEISFKTDEFDRTTDGLSLTLYAKWSESGSINTNSNVYTAGFEEQGLDMLYANDNNCRSDKYSLTEENGNHYMKFSNLDLNAKDAHISSYFAIYDNKKLAQNGAPTSPVTANAEGIKYMLLNGAGNKKIYKVSFDYRVNQVAEGKSVSVYFGYTSPANVHGGAQTLSTDSILDINAVPENIGWSSHTAYIIIDTSTVTHWANHAVSIALRGYAEVDFDNIVLEDYTSSGLKGYLFVTNSNLSLEPILGNSGDPVAIENLSDTQDAKFEGWYTDSALTEKFAGADKIGDDFVVLYAKWQAIRIVQDFENWPYVLGAMTFDRDMIYNSPTAESYDESGVHGGKSSIFRNNEMNVTARLMTWQSGMPKLTIGEKYVFRVWIKPVIKRNPSAALSIILTDSNTSCWGTSKNTTRLVAGYYSKLISKEWNLIEFEFEANRPYLAFEFDGVNTAYIDDISITLKSADDPSKIDYSSAANYNGTKEDAIVYETFPIKDNVVVNETYSSQVTGKIISSNNSNTAEPPEELTEETQEQSEEQINASEDEENTTSKSKRKKKVVKVLKRGNNTNYVLVIGISVAAAVVLATITVIVIVKIKKKKGGIK